MTKMTEEMVRSYFPQLIRDKKSGICKKGS